MLQPFLYSSEGSPLPLNIFYANVYLVIAKSLKTFIKLSKLSNNLTLLLDGLGSSLLIYFSVFCWRVLKGGYCPNMFQFKLLN